MKFFVVFQEDHLCLSCVPVSGVKRMALSGEVFGNRMCYLEDISNEVERKYSMIEIHGHSFISLFLFLYHVMLLFSFFFSLHVMSFFPA
jgi:hypothetical protein